MSHPTSEQVLDALRGVIDPDLGRDIVSLDFIRKCEVSPTGDVDVVINLTTPACPMKEQMRRDAQGRIEALEGIGTVSIEMTAEVAAQQRPERQLAGNIKHVVAVSSGKGGVGKSTVAVNLACALARTGARVGLLDCDVYGPDIPMMMGIEGRPEAGGSEEHPVLVPKERFGVKTMSVGYFLAEDQPVVWRGPMINHLLKQFLGDVEWGELDYLLVDMPPGTGDAQLSLAQLVPLTGAIVVTTPQAVSTFDVTKAVNMFAQVNTPVLGVVENMSGYVIEGVVEDASPSQRVRLTLGDKQEELELDEQGRFSTVAHLFGQGGGDRIAERFDVPLLGRLPLDPTLRVGGDGGDPVVTTQPDSPAAKLFEQIAGAAAQRIAMRAFATLPVLD